MTSLGDMLIEARKEAGLSAHDIAQRTRIMQSAIHNLEDDKLGVLPAAGYVRGYILSYCKICNVDPQPFLEQYERQSGSSRRDGLGKTPYGRSEQRLGSRQTDSEMNWKVIVAIIVIIAIVAGAIYFVNQGEDNFVSRALPTSVEATALAEMDGLPLQDEENPVALDDLTPFALTVRAREGMASDVSIIVDGNLAFYGALTSDQVKSFD
ncbi:MAG: helix-turn-helix domain-containing protein, partial [Coriobacteriia bacterium]|nr:helix-turn-helix domain-containing protein [Coriobacteriia bacterium]